MAKEIKPTDEIDVAPISSDSAPETGAVSEGVDAAPKRRRGRPRKTEVQSAAEDVEAAPAKKRGRPRKKAAEDAPEGDAVVAETQQTDASEEPSDEQKPKRRGRPRKTAVETVEEDAKPKRRGRPRKNPEPEAPVESDATESLAAEEAPVATAEVVEEKPKRRGRPRKVAEPEVQPTAEDKADESAPVEDPAVEEKPKRRGRPRKVADVAPAAASATEQVTDEAPVEAPATSSDEASVSAEAANEAASEIEDETPVVVEVDPTPASEQSQDTPVMGVRRRRVGGVRRTISEAIADEAQPAEASVSEDAPRRVRRTRRVTSEEELRAAKAEVDAAKKQAALADSTDDIEDAEDILADAEVLLDDQVDETPDTEEAKPEKVKRKKVNEPTLSLDEVATWKVAELREKAKELDIDPTGIRKAELIELVFEENAKREGYKSFSGIFDPSQDGFGFIRSNNYVSGKEDVFVAKHLIRKFGLRAGDFVEGATQPPRAHNQLPQLLSVTKINGLDPDEARKRPRFKNLTPIYPQERLVMEHGKNSLTGRAIDIVAPIGKGQRGLIVSPPKAGKTTILKKICESIAINNPEVHLICLLIDERPEEVTDMKRSIKGEVVASTFDMPPENHTQISELVMERAKRLVEQGEDVVVVLDSITRLARAYNLALPASGRILSGGFDSAALYPPKRFLGAARNIEGGGSLTILASALIDTGSKMDEVIFEEFKGTGNMELKLDRDLSNKRIYPAIDPIASGTRNEDLLVDELTRQCMWGLRRTLANVNNSERAQTMLLKGLKSTKDNQEFLLRAAKKANMSEYAEFDKTE